MPNRTRMIEQVQELIESMDEFEQVGLHNEFCLEVNTSDSMVFSMVFSMEELDDVLGDVELSEALRMAHDGNFNLHHEFFMFDGYGNLKSGYGDDLVHLYDIARYIVEEENPLGNSEIEDLLDEFLWEVE